MIERFRAFSTVVAEGSVNRAAVRLRIGQPALSRQMKALEQEMGGRLLEREARGVQPTGLGHTLLEALRPVLASYDAALAEVRRQARGLRSELRVGYLISAAQPLLAPALARLRETHGDLKLRLHDMSPREQIDALRAGQLDLALTGQEGAVAARDFHSRKLTSLGVVAALAGSDPLASRSRLALAELKGHDFVGIDEAEMPGRNRWMQALCRAAGFRPRFGSVIDGITHVLSQVVAETGVTLLPDYFRNYAHPGVVYVPISDARARWDLIVLWQRGSASPATRALIDALAAAASGLAKRGRGSAEAKD